MRTHASPMSGGSDHVTQRKQYEPSVEEAEPATQAWPTDDQPGIFEAPAELELEELEDEFDADLDAQTVMARGLRGAGYAQEHEARSVRSAGAATLTNGLGQNRFEVQSQRNLHMSDVALTSYPSEAGSSILGVKVIGANGMSVQDNSINGS